MRVDAECTRCYPGRQHHNCYVATRLRSVTIAFADLLTPNLPQAMAEVARDLAQIREDVHEGLGRLASQGDKPDQELLVIPISSAQIPNAWYAAPVQLRVVAVDFWTDSLGRYALVIENDNSINFRANPNVKNRVIDPPGRLVVARGLRVTFNVPAGSNAVWDAIVYAYAGTAKGRESA